MYMILYTIKLIKLIQWRGIKNPIYVVYERPLWLKVCLSCHKIWSDWAATIYMYIKNIGFFKYFK